MPLFTTPTGETVYIPGVYSLVRAVSGTPTPLPEFHTPILVGGAPQGIPYTAKADREAHETFNPWTYFGTNTAAAAVMGQARDAEAIQAAEWAARAGHEGSFFINASALVRGNVVCPSTGPVAELNVFPRLFGAPPTFMKLKWTSGGAVEVIPLKRFTAVTEAFSSGTRIYVADNSWAVPGLAMELGDNDTSNVAAVVAGTGEETLANGQKRYWIDLASSVTVTLTLADFPYAVVYDTAASETATGITTTAQFFTWARYTSRLIDCTKTGTYTGAAPVAYLSSATPLKQISTWGTVTPGESPAATATDFADLITLLDAGMYNDFALAEGRLMRAFFIGTSSATAHASFGTWARSMRTRRRPVNVTAGCAWGDVVVSASDSTSPVYRARALNNQDFCLVANGMSYLGSYLTRAAFVWGARCAGGVGHNLTSDPFPIEPDEVTWNEDGLGEITSLTRAGVVTNRLKYQAPVGYVITQGLSTYQTNIQAWDTAANASCLVMQRDLADAVDAAMLDALGAQQGADGVDPDSIRSVMFAKIGQVTDRGWLRPGTGRVLSVTPDDSGAGYNVTWTGSPPRTVDFIGSTLNLLV
jgi:hypothetical protein